MNIATSTSQSSPQIGMPPALIDGVSQQEINAAVREHVAKSRAKPSKGVDLSERRRLFIDVMIKKAAADAENLKQALDSESAEGGGGK
ncbi:hypothetical protein CBF45_16850 [Bordetella sp. J329]|nr:hypothetical protein CBF45_16850 [Bordetella sp. J329]